VSLGRWIKRNIDQRLRLAGNGVTVVLTFADDSTASDLFFFVRLQVADDDGRALDIVEPVALTEVEAL
jgi:hypothetical protein